MEPYDSLDDVIFYAAQAAREMGANKTEYMSVVYQAPDGRYQFAEPQGGEHRAKADAKLTFPKGSKLLALVHNHPGMDVEDGRGDRGQSKFSPEDVQQAKELGIPSYITYGADMTIRDRKSVV